MENEAKRVESGSHFVTKTSDKEDWFEFLTNVLDRSSTSWYWEIWRRRTLEYVRWKLALVFFFSRFLTKWLPDSALFASFSWEIFHVCRAEPAIISTQASESTPAILLVPRPLGRGTSLKMLGFFSSTSRNRRRAVLGTSILCLAPCSLLALREVLPKHYGSHCHSI